ncbi:hypothetical protein PCL1606_33480 [Pseudomonas chlororaphis]|uniref:Uncharacterized protein n=1 Tax=Pseudomonas chlororaphis TaxID=587753 RepID=A0A0D5Y0E3_9PSED|nr:hypothetical protein PCL1606_33480 [Pseudomonas chlororaphis]
MGASQQPGFPRFAYGNHGPLPKSDSLIIAKPGSGGPGPGSVFARWPATGAWIGRGHG